MSGPTREQVIAWAEESGVAYQDGVLLCPAIRECCDMTDEVTALVALAYAAGQVAEREARVMPMQIRPRGQKGGAVAKSTNEDTPWIEWSGGRRPVADHVAVEVRFRFMATDTGTAGDFCWGHTLTASSYDIVAYRVVEVGA